VKKKRHGTIFGPIRKRHLTPREERGEEKKLVFTYAWAPVSGRKTEITIDWGMASTISTCTRKRIEHDKTGSDSPFLPSDKR
jgi:hypothetical protein